MQSRCMFQVRGLGHRSCLEQDCYTRYKSGAILLVPSTAEVCDAVFRERCRISDVETLTSVEKPTSASTREMVALWCRSEPRRSNRASGAVTTTNCACGWRHRIRALCLDHDHKACAESSIRSGRAHTLILPEPAQPHQSGERMHGCDRHAEWRSPQRLRAAGRVQFISHLEVACVSIHHGLALLEERDLLRHKKNGRIISTVFQCLQRHGGAVLGGRHI